MANTIGERLKQAREAKGLSLEQASRAIHVRPHYLEALENDDRAALPSNVQGRGFLRLYADLLDLPIEPLLASWDGIATLPDLNDQVYEPTVEIPLEELEEVPSTDPDLSTASEDAPSSEPVIVERKPAEEGSQAIFREIGHTLRVQRELLGLSLPEVERFTRLRQHYIQAMEEGRMDGLPSPVQGKGMLSNYAAFLNLDEEAVLLRFAEGLQTRRIERLPKPESQSLFNTKKKPARRAPFWKRFLTPDLIFGVGLAAIILLFVLWTSARIDTQNRSQAEPTAPAISEILLTPEEFRSKLAATIDPTIGPIPEETAVDQSNPNVISPENSATPDGNGIETNSQGSENPAVEQGQGLPSTNNTFSLPTATLAPINDDPLQVYIIAHARAWLKVSTDGKVAFLGRVIPGNAYAFSGEKQVELLTGSGAAIQVIYNQNDLGRLGLTGEVVGLIFAAEGIMTPTPAFTATPTQAPPATITPLPSPTLPATPTVTPFIP